MMILVVAAEGEYLTSAIAAAVALVLIWFLTRRKSSRSDAAGGAYPSYLPSPTKKGHEAGWMETIAGITGSRAPQFVHRSMQALPPGKTWIGRLRITMRKPCPCGFIVADADIAKAILTDAATTKPKGYDEFDFVCGGPNILSTNGTKWMHARKGVAPAFSSNHIKRMNRICGEQLERWRGEVLDPLAEEGKSFDVGREMIYLTLRIISEAAFEYEMSRTEMDSFIEAFEVASREFIIWDPLHRHFQFLFPQVWRAKRASKVLQKIAHKIMESYRRSSEKGEGGSLEKKNKYADDTIISRIVNNKSYANDGERAADIIIFLIAGHDTTAYSIAWALIEVAKNKTDTQLKDYRDLAATKKQEDWRRIDQLQYIIKEGMRLHPVAAMGSARQAGREFKFKNDDGSSDLQIPIDAFMWINFFAMFRNKKYFGEDADVFRPCRWKNADIGQRAYMPFSLGVRNCVGQTLANAEMNTVLSILLARYDFTIDEEGEDDFFLTLKPKGTKLIPHCRVPK
mmetsp:Transcript_3023/g.6618  ORF Transcript_3023/g.6618 Transcript_3023/m.6618 type:complete len:512 (+) Transcript_3023:88-1623(+)